tara:strand:- start:277 stop:675 length:399 start_codon:yes stop_codon:yes gene_type:complete
MIHIYELRAKDSLRTLLYIGQSACPKARLYDHIKRNPLKSPKAGRFYGQDIEMVVLEGYATRAEARQAETLHKIAKGLPPTERLIAQNNIAKVNATRKKCPHCDMITTPGALVTHIKFSHPSCLPSSLTQSV